MADTPDYSVPGGTAVRQNGTRASGAGTQGDRTGTVRDRAGAQGAGSPRGSISEGVPVDQQGRR